MITRHSALLAFTVAALGVAFLVPPFGSAEVTTENNCTINCRSINKYLKYYAKAYDKVGAEVGRNIVVDGYGDTYREPTQSEVNESIERMDLILHPPPPPPVAAPVATTTYTGGTVVSSGLESIAQCESGGDYGAVNPSSGAYGKYQILPSTSASYGCDMSSPAGQDACAAEIYAAEGGSAWVC